MARMELGRLVTESLQNISARRATDDDLLFALEGSGASEGARQPGSGYNPHTGDYDSGTKRVKEKVKSASGWKKDQNPHTGKMEYTGSKLRRYGAPALGAGALIAGGALGYRYLKKRKKARQAA